MSNIYIQEPPTNGKVLLETSVGDIDIELWAKETPKACRNFIQLCLENYYNGTIFHRVVKGFILQGGDPTGTGQGGESIYGQPFKDEFHSRLRFVRRGLVAMANAGKDDNGSQFFFTLGPTPELLNKHTIFGKITGDTLYNMIKMEDALVDKDDRPMYPHRINKTKVLLNPFDDITPRPPAEESVEKSYSQVKKSKIAAKKNFSLLSFGEEAEEDEEEVSLANQKFSSKSKSSHDLTNDPRLSSVPAVSQELEQAEDEQDSEFQKSSKRKAGEEILGEDMAMEQLEKIRKKLKKEIVREELAVDDVTLFSAENEEKERIRDNKVLEIKDEIKKLKKEMAQAKKGVETKNIPKEENIKPHDEVIGTYLKEREVYQSIRNDGIGKKGSTREVQTLAILAKFQDKLLSAREQSQTAELEEEKKDHIEQEEDGGDDDNEEGWMVHRLHFETNDPVQAKDANKKEDDWFDIYDPRNPINKRRREAPKDGFSRR